MAESYLLRRIALCALAAAVALEACGTLGDRLGVDRLPARSAHEAEEGVPPEAGTGYRPRPTVRSSRSMVGAANPYASRAGLEILRVGGNAIDAAVTMSLVLGLVEPQSSGIGGGGFLVYFDARSTALTTWEGRETAPRAATPDMFLGADGKPREFMDAVVGGLSVGTPGLVRMLEAAHRKRGRLPWARLFTPAIRLAENGFEISPRLHALVSTDPALGKMAAARAYFFDANGRPKDVGTKLVNPQYAEVLRTLARGGADAFYAGPLARDIVAAVRSAERNPGRLALEDLAEYEAKERPAVCVAVRASRVCGAPPPSSGGIAVGQILAILSLVDVSSVPADSVEAAHLFAEASRLAFADRGLYVADPEFVPVPTAELLDTEYLAARARLVDPKRSMGKAAPGVLAGSDLALASDRSLELPATTHLVAIDADGNVVSMTNSVEAAFGSRIMVQGFLLNNQLTDFSFVPETDGKPIANRVEPRKRPRSSMSPTIVLDSTGKIFRAAIGSPGGSQIIDYVAQALHGVEFRGLDLRTAIDRPHVANRNGKTEIEVLPGFEAWLESVRSGLRALGHDVEARELNSGLQAVIRTRDGYEGASDARREGLILGD